ATSFTQQRTEPGTDGPTGPFRVDGVELTVERRQLYGDVDARQRPGLVAVDDGDFGPGADFLAQLGQKRQVLALRSLGLRFGDGGLAEQINREGELAAAQGRDGAEGLVNVRAGNEAPCQPFG